MKNRLVKFVKEKNLNNFPDKLKEIIMVKKSQVKGSAQNKTIKENGSMERMVKRGNGMLERRRSSND